MQAAGAWLQGAACIAGHAPAAGQKRARGRVGMRNCSVCPRAAGARVQPSAVPASCPSSQPALRRATLGFAATGGSCSCWAPASWAGGTCACAAPTGWRSTWAGPCPPPRWHPTAAPPPAPSCASQGSAAPCCSLPATSSAGEAPVGSVCTAAWVGPHAATECCSGVVPSCLPTHFMGADGLSLPLPLLAPTRANQTLLRRLVHARPACPGSRPPAFHLPNWLSPAASTAGTPAAAPSAPSTSTPLRRALWRSATSGRSRCAR